jgi:hypothetical protein
MIFSGAHYGWVLLIKLAKGLWDKVIVMHGDTTIIHITIYDVAKSDMNMFMISDGESL